MRRESDTPIRNIEAKIKHHNDDENVIDKLRKALRHYGKKSIFSLIKHFRYYDNGTRFINKTDFVKVLRDFRINITTSDIERLFENFVVDRKQQLLNHEQFLFTLFPPMNNERSDLVEQVYDSLSRYGNIDMNLIKNYYNGKNHLLVKENEEAVSEFLEGVDSYLAYRMKKTNSIAFEDFKQIYRIISFFIDDDNMFINMVLNEWVKLSKKQEKQNFDHEQYYTVPEKKTETKPEIRISENTERPKTPKTPDARPKTPVSKHDTVKTKNYDPLQLLTEKLRRRGIRGLMNLHKQFLLSCGQLGSISYGDFVKVLKLQKIELHKDDYDNIFDLFKQQVKNSLGITSFLNFPHFIRNFKQVLADKRLVIVEKAFSILDTTQSEMLSIEEVKFKFNSANHPAVRKGILSEDEIAVEFLDCFDLNYNFLVSIF